MLMGFRPDLSLLVGEITSVASVEKSNDVSVDAHEYVAKLQSALAALDSRVLREIENQFQHNALNWR
jgi:hypothetical protein